MNFNEHYYLKDKHAFLSPSKYHWINYDEEKMKNSYTNYLKKEMGTRLHEFAAEAINLGIKMPRSKKTLNQYINDAIGYKMSPEVPLAYSENAFGTADAISFKRNLLRIHDLKTGTNKASINQLLIYAAYFCLEYEYKPSDIKMELRIYQNDEIIAVEPDPVDIQVIMDKTVESDKIIDFLKSKQ